MPRKDQNWEDHARELGINLNRVEGITCPQCGEKNPPDTTICQKTGCSTLLTSPKWAHKDESPPAAHRATESEKRPLHGQSVAEESDTAHESSTNGGGYGGDPPNQRPRRRRTQWWAYLIPTAILIGGPIVYGAGYLSSFHRAQALKTTTNQFVTPPSSSVHSTKQATPSQTPPASAHSKTSAAPAADPSPQVPARQQGGIHGTLLDAHDEGFVWVTNPHTHQRVKATVWIDTGAQVSQISAQFAQRMGFRVAGSTVVEGYGGQSTVHKYAGITAWSTHQGGTSLFYRVTLMAGIDSIQGHPDILLGENFLEQGVLVQDETHWTFHFVGPMAPNGPPLEQGDLGISLPPGPQGTVPVRGQVVNSELVAPAAMGLRPQSVKPGKLVVDTGAFTTTVNGQMLQRLFDAKPGPAAYYYGVGGRQNAHIYYDLYLRSQQSPTYLLTNATMVSGVAQDAGWGPQVEMAIGQDVLAHSLFWQVGNQWGADIEPLVGNWNMPQNQAPWYYPTNWHPNPGP